jgi:putative ABC transport system permease protein
MIQNYLRIAVRNILKYKGYSFINILGLAIGMAACILIMLYVQFELSYDRYHENADRIYRVTREWLNEDRTTSLHLGHVAPPFGPLLKNDFGDIIERVVRFLRIPSPLVSYDDKHLIEPRFFLAEPDVFDIFSFNLIEGDPETALNGSNSVIITEQTARKYFGDEDPIGKILRFRTQFNPPTDLMVTGVLAETPMNSHFKFDMLASFRIIEDLMGMEFMMRNFGSNNYSTFLLLGEDATIDELEEQIPAFLNRHLPGSAEVLPSQRNNLHFWPLTSIHLYSNLDSEIEQNGNITLVYIYILIALFILFIACVNFVNLTTARSITRAREVALRKVIGAYRTALVRQFIGESVLITIIALIAAIVLIELILPSFNNFLQTDLSIRYLDNFLILAGLLAFALLVGIAAGSYPAFYLSSFQPAPALKGQYSSGRGHASFRSALVVTQFTISITLFVCMVIVVQQLDYMRTKELGFNKDNIAALPVNTTIIERSEDIRNQLLAQPGIVDASISSRIPSGRLLDSQGATAEIDGDMKSVNFRIADIHIDHEFFSAYGVTFVAGRDFDPALASDSTEAFVLNEAAIRTIGWQSPEDAIGKGFHYGSRRGYVIGVVQDFHFESLHNPIVPIVFFIHQGRISNFSVRFAEKMREEVLGYLEEQWAYWRPDYPFTYTLIEDNYNLQYDGEERLATVFRSFTLLAIIIAALGLFGLASFAANRRVKEIGIRKVLGASGGQIFVLLSQSFTKLILISIIISVPVAYFAMNLWLHSYAYRTDIKPGVFIIAGIAALLVTLITVSYQSIRAAMTNPVESLRYE